MPDRDDSDREIMTSLPRTRPVRRSDKRPTRAVSENATPDGATRTAAAPDKPRGARKPRSAPKATTASNGAAPREPRRTPRPKPAAATSETEARGDDAAAQVPPAEPTAEPAAPPPKRKVPAAGYATPALRPEERESAVVDLVSTTLQAAHELVHIGVDVGRAAVRSILDRLPRA